MTLVATVTKITGIWTQKTAYKSACIGENSDILIPNWGFQFNYVIQTASHPTHYHGNINVAISAASLLQCGLYAR